MTIAVHVRNESSIKRLHRRDVLQRQAERICAGEGIRGPAEVSVLLCDDVAIQTLNRDFREIDRPTDVLSFEQDDPGLPGPKVLGDVVISLETIASHCHGDREQMREELRLLFCHGLLHLLGYDHATAAEQQEMMEKQRAYLDCSADAAWQFGPRHESPTRTTRAQTSQHARGRRP